MSNPKTDTLLRVYRGGSWDNFDPSWVRVALLSWSGPTYRDIDLGFRCARVGSERKVKP